VQVLAVNSGLDAQESIVKLQEEAAANPGQPVGLDLVSGEAMLPMDAGVLDNYRVKRQLLQSRWVVGGERIVLIVCPQNTNMLLVWTLV
jgi:T-complex protein 1 subunit zeta